MSQPSTTHLSDHIRPSDRLDALHARFEAERTDLMAAYLDEFPDLSEEAATVAYDLCGYPGVVAGDPQPSHQERLAWDGWQWHCDADAFSRLDGRDFMACGVLLYEAWDPREVVAGLERFIHWLADRGTMRRDDERRLLGEIDEPCAALIEVMARHAAEKARYGGREPEQVVAPFVGWLRDTTQRPLEHLLFAQAFAIEALHRVRRGGLLDAPWQELDVNACLAAVDENASMLGMTSAHCRAMACAFANYLHEQRSIGRALRARWLLSIGAPAPTRPDRA